MNDKIIQIVTELQAISQIGLTFCHDSFDYERYSRIREISVELVSIRVCKNFLINLLSAITAYSLQPNKPSLKFDQLEKALLLV